MATKHRKFAKAKENFESTSITTDVGQSTASNASLPANNYTDNHDNDSVQRHLIVSSSDENNKSPHRNNHTINNEVNSTLSHNQDNSGMYVVMGGNIGNGSDSSSDDEDETAHFLDSRNQQFHGENMQIDDFHTVTAIANNNSFRNTPQIMNDITPPVKRPKVMSIKEQHCIASRFHYWTDEMDDLLTEAQGLYGKQWMKIAAHVGHGKTDRHCFKRWTHHVTPNMNERVYKPWTTVEDETLMAQYQIQVANENASKARYPDGSSKDTGIATVNFQAIAKALSRDAKECRVRVKQLEFLRGVVSTPFTKADDDKLRSCVENWGGNSRGRWAGLAREMNRDAKALLVRWVELSTDEFGVVNAQGTAAAAGGVGEDLSGSLAQLPDHFSDVEEYDDVPLTVMTSSSSQDQHAQVMQFYSSTSNTTAHAKSQRKAVAKDYSNSSRMEHALKRFAWSDEADERLRAAYELCGNSWKKVAEHVGQGVTNIQCQKRWTRNANPEMQSRPVMPWSQEDEDHLRLLVDMHHTGVGSGKGKVGVINWSVISKELGRHYKHCMIKWKTLQIATMRKGRFTPEEDAVIVQRVREWMGRGQGLWAALERELNRNAASVLTRWNLTLSLKYPQPSLDELAASNKHARNTSDNNIGSGNGGGGGGSMNELV